MICPYFIISTECYYRIWFRYKEGLARRNGINIWKRCRRLHQWFCEWIPVRPLFILHSNFDQLHSDPNIAVSLSIYGLYCCFSWLDKLGQAAQLGIEVVMQSTFIDGDRCLVEIDPPYNPLPVSIAVTLLKLWVHSLGWVANWHILKFIYISTLASFFILFWQTNETKVQILCWCFSLMYLQTTFSFLTDPNFSDHTNPTNKINLARLLKAF